MRNTRFIVLFASAIFINGYAADYGKETTAALSKPNEFYIATAHLDGNTSAQGDQNHPPEAIPDTELPKGGGLSIKKGDQGAWRIRMFTFIPSQILVPVDQEITLHFVGVQGPSHRIKVEGIDEEIQLKRGEIKTITLRPTQPGTLHFYSLNHQPSMSGQIIVRAK